MNQPRIEGNLYYPNTDTLAEGLNQYGNASWAMHYHRDRNAQETHNATLSRPTFRLAIKDQTRAKPKPSARPEGTVPCPLIREP
ncbi:MULTISPECIES: hypothetical protein [unclassified Curtobacterium]|uniref:hypothetical protein n=1 Tax=unclassified Curtobacterium TaxID=257496 RepID=UPI00226B7A67|nr:MULTISPECIES: hypothetical protein [unclassified Curtobacterium]